MIKTIIAILILLLGVALCVVRVREYRKNVRGAITEDFLNLFSFGPDILFAFVMILLGGGWLIYLLVLLLDCTIGALDGLLPK